MPTIGPMRSHGSRRSRRRGAGTAAGRTPGPVPVTVSGLPGLLTQLTARPVIPAPPGSGAAYWLPPDNTRRHCAAKCPAEPDSAWSGFVFRPFASASSDVLAWSVSPVACPVRSGTAGREVRLHDRAGSGRVGAGVRAAVLESLQCLEVAEREHHLQACAFLHFGKVKHGIDQARAAARGDVPGLGAQRRPGGSARSFGGDLGCGHCALRVADLDVPIQFPPGPARRPAAAGLPGRRERIGAIGRGAQPTITAVARTRRGDGSRTGSRSGTGHGARAVRTSH